MSVQASENFVRSSFITLLFALVVVASACGPQPPTASASASAEAVPAGSVVQLDGSASSDENGAPLSFEWFFVRAPAGSAALLNQSTLMNPSFVADLPGEFEIALIVDNGEFASTPATVIVTANPCGANAPVIAEITSTDASRVDAPVQLMASVSDADNESACFDEGVALQALTYAWQLVSQPIGSMTRLLQTDVENPSFLPDMPGDYGVVLTVTDSTGRAASLAATIAVATCGASAPVIASVTVDGAAPEAAAPDLGDVVTLAVAATDDDLACGANESLSFAWRLLAVPAGSMARLNDATLESPSLTPDVGPGDYVVDVTVTDATGKRTTSAPITVSASGCGMSAPIADIHMLLPSASDVSGALVVVSDIVQLSTGDTSDPDVACRPDDALFYAWELLAAPAGSSASLSQDGGETTWFSPDRAGDYLVRLRASDGAHESAPVEFVITASSP